MPQPVFPICLRVACASLSANMRRLSRRGRPAHKRKYTRHPFFFNVSSVHARVRSELDPDTNV